MKLTKWQIGNIENGYGIKGIILMGGENRILSVAKTKTGFKFTEECDGRFEEVYSKEEANKIADELKKWINAK